MKYTIFNKKKTEKYYHSLKDYDDCSYSFILKDMKLNPKIIKFEPGFSFNECIKFSFKKLDYCIVGYEK